MTLPSQITAETMLGNGSTRSFPFTFRAWTGEIKVIVTDPAGNEADVTALSVVTVYAYEAEGSQAGGSVTYPAASLSPPLPEGWKITIMRDMNLLQDERLVNASRFDPVVVEMALDRLTATDQQLAEKAARTVTVPVGSEQTPQELLGSIYAARDSAAASASNAAASSTAAAGSASDAGAAQAGAAASAAEAAGSASRADGSADQAAEWADNPEDVPVHDAGAEAKFSARHWAEKAKQTVSSGLPFATETLKGGAFAATREEAQTGNSAEGREAVFMTPERTSEAVAERLEPVMARLGAIGDSTARVAGLLLPGLIQMFYGAFGGENNKFPIDRATGQPNLNYALCDGGAYAAPDGTEVTTPDLRDRFILGAGGAYPAGAAGGSMTSGNTTLSTSQIPSHNHSTWAHSVNSSRNPNAGIEANNGLTRNATTYVNATGGGGSHNHSVTPPYYALAFIMKL